MSFKNKLKNIINEHDSTTFMNRLVYTDLDNTSAIEGIISAAAPLNGLKYLGAIDGVLSFSTYKKESVLSFTTFLDDSDVVEVYDISVGITDPFTSQVEIEKDIEFDNIVESDFLEFFIDVAIVDSKIDYNGVYITPDSEPSISLITNDVEDSFDTVQDNEVPLLIKISNTESANETGRFIVTIDSADEDLILIQVIYDDFPSDDELEEDLITINLGLFGDSFSTNFDLVREATINYDLGIITPAVYKAIKSNDVVDIVESFGDGNTVYYDCLLHEIERKVKVNFKGKRRIKMQCQPGFKYDTERKTCVKISGAEMAHSRIAHRQMSRTKKSKGMGYKTRIIRKVRRAMRFRKMMGAK